MSSIIQNHHFDNLTVKNLQFMNKTVPGTLLFFNNSGNLDFLSPPIQTFSQVGKLSENYQSGLNTIKYNYRINQIFNNYKKSICLTSK